MDFLSNLNKMQKEAATTVSGPLLILAGAGSGKTTVLVNRIAFMLNECNISPFSILAITFTNKAANEMKERIKSKIGDVVDNMWIGTFHSMCVRILRSTIDRIGFDPKFLIYDTNDSKLIIKECMKELDINDKNLQVKSVMTIISHAKDSLITPKQFEEENMGDFRLSLISKIYTLYQKKLKKNNAVDFDDIIVKTIQILSENNDILEKYQNKFKYIMVDEYQDTNHAQFKLIGLLSGEMGNLCVVGDDDQSIYKFRGADITNILDFERVFKNAKVVKLEQNYRSTQNILDSANAVIANNNGRKGKNLWTEQGSGEKITVFKADNEHDEAQYIAHEIADRVKSGQKYSDSAILYRTNAQSRVLEEVFVKMKIPYRVLAGLRFYDRKEIKDVIAYLRLIYNQTDVVSLKRIINEPKRGIGTTTIDKAEAIANDMNISVYDVIDNADNYSTLKRAASNLTSFTQIINSLIAQKDIMPLSEFIAKVIDETGYGAQINQLAQTEGSARAENVKELISAVKEYENENGDDASLGDFLERISLVSDVDNYDESTDSVIFMTIHSAKGLEFPIVFLPGMENGLFPGNMSLTDPEDIEEERRLCYVAITRAKVKLYITYASMRMLYGRTVCQPQSIFLKEIPDSFKESRSSKKAVVKDIFNKVGYVSNPKSYGSVWRKTEVKKPTIQFKIGDRVEHSKFGVGTVLSAQVFGDDTKLDILFDEHGKKMLMSNFAKLQKIN